MIPKKIHYIWIGKKTKSKLTEICINSWRRNMSDYEIIEWNENNLNIEQLCKENKFFKKCYHLKLWAFVSDYLRLYILYQYGGIYLDTDVESIKSFTPLLNDCMFIGYEGNGYIGTGIIAAEQHNMAIKRLLDFYDDEIWKVNFYLNPIIFKFVMEQEPVNFAECKVYPQCYFSPYKIGTVYHNKVETDETYTIHWYTKNWNMGMRGYVFLQTKHIRNPLNKFFLKIRKCLGFIRYGAR